MKLLQLIKTSRDVEKLKQSRNLSADELARVEANLLAQGSASIQPLIECLAHGDARGPAIALLGKLADAGTLPIYVRALTSANPVVVSGVARALEQSTAYDPRLLLEYVSDPAAPLGTLESILSAHVTKLGPSALIDVLVAPETRKESRAVAFRLLERVADRANSARLLPLLAHDDWWMRASAARLLSGFPSDAAIEKITALLGDSHRGVRLEAAKALVAAKAHQAVPALAAVLRDPDLKVQTAAIDALIALGDASSVPCLLDVLRDESEYVRRAAVEVLNQVATTEAIQDLVRALRDEDWWVRVRAADALGTLGGEKVVEAVCGLLADPDDFVRRYAIEVLNSVPSQRAVGPLIGALDDLDWWVRERSIDALGKTKDPRAIDPLVEMVQRDSTLATLCTHALAEIGEPQAIESLCALAHSERQEVRAAAVDALRPLPLSGLDPELRSLIGQAVGQDGAADASNIPLRVESRRSGLGPEAGRTPAPASGRTPTPGSPPGVPRPTASLLELSAPHQHAGQTGRMDQTAGGGHLLDQPEGRPGRRERADFYDLVPETILLNRYRVLRTIGKGGFGVVYLVHDSAIRDETILKVLNPQLSTDELAIMRFVRELKLSRKITHKNVIRIHDLLDLGGAMAVSMEYFPGQDLGKILQQEGMMNIDRALVVLAQVCEGLAAAHAAGVIHRDVKPANILVGKDDTVKIVDFGLASARQQIGSRLTKSGLLVGTPEYMAPEQISHGVVDPRTDVYSVGILSYELLAGRQPYRGETAVQTLFQHLEGTADPLSSIRQGISTDLEALVVKAMAREPVDRYQSADDLRRAILAVHATAGEPAPDG